MNIKKIINNIDSDGIRFNDCIIIKNVYNDITWYSVFDCNGVFISNYFDKTLNQVKKDLLES